MRRYGKHQRFLENQSQCVVIIYDDAVIGYSHQCRHKRGKGPGGLYCGIHANQIAKGNLVSVPEDK